MLQQQHLDKNNEEVNDHDNENRPLTQRIHPSATGNSALSALHEISDPCKQNIAVRSSVRSTEDIVKYFNAEHAHLYVPSTHLPLTLKEAAKLNSKQLSAKINKRKTKETLKVKRRRSSGEETAKARKKDFKENQVSHQNRKTSEDTN